MADIVRMTSINNGRLFFDADDGREYVVEVIDGKVTGACLSFLAPLEPIDATGWAEAAFADAGEMLQALWDESKFGPFWVRPRANG